MNTNHPIPLIAKPVNELSGDITVPGDKSISHRAVILGSLTIGTTTVSGLLEGEDVLATIKAARQFGAHLERSPDGVWSVDGFGTGGFAEPADVIDCGNSGTGVRLLMGAMATSPITAVFSGDESLRSRPMNRVLQPVTMFGAQCFSRRGGLLPATVLGAKEPVPVFIDLAVPSAQVKSAILLAGLNAPGTTVLSETALTRDHTENMLAAFGATIKVEEHGAGKRIELEGHADFEPQHITVPGDPSSAAFPIVAALITEGSAITVRGVCTNPTRTGLYTTLRGNGRQIGIRKPAD